jgi:hypothetical protein
MMKDEIDVETCVICGDETGRAGRGDDSIYAVWMISPPTLKSRKANDEIGPLCVGCYDCLRICGFISN